MFTYCNNNPLCYVDHSGCIPVWLTVMCVSGLSNGIMSLIMDLYAGGTLQSALNAFVDGFLEGFLTEIPVFGEFISIQYSVSALFDTFDEYKVAGATDAEALSVACLAFLTSLIPGVDFTGLRNFDEIIGVLLADFGLNYLPELGNVIAQNTVDNKIQERRDAIPLTNVCTGGILNGVPPVGGGFGGGGGIGGVRTVNYAM